MSEFIPKTTRRTRMIRRAHAVAIAVAVALVLCNLTSPIAEATGHDWSPAIQLAKLVGARDVQISEPYVITDQEGGVHVFWTRIVDPKDASHPPASVIDYTRLTGSRWSAPTDVVASKGTPVHDAAAAIDWFGKIHLFWEGGGSAGFTSTASVARADVAAAWSKPLRVELVGLSGQVLPDAFGRLARVYPGPGASGVFYQESADGGATWSFPATVARTGGRDASAAFAREAVGPDGVIHAVWSEFKLPNGWPPLGVYYTHSKDGGHTWSNPVQIAGSGFDQANVAAGPGGLVHVAWNGMAGIQGRYDRWSNDDGETWSGAVSLNTLGVSGTEGAPQLAIDRSGVVHLVTTDGNRVWYLTWIRGQWTKPEYVPSGDEARLPADNVPIDPKQRHIEQAVMTLGQGNRLHVVFWDHRPRENVTYVWYTSKEIAAPHVPVVPFAAQPAEELPRTGTAPDVRGAERVESPRARLYAVVTSRRGTIDGRWTILAGLAPALAIVGGAFLHQFQRIRQH